MPDAMVVELQEAARQLLVDGYCLLEDRLPEAQATEMAADFIRMHADAALAGDKHVQPGYETLFGMLNRDDRTWDCAFHPDTVAIARHILGGSGRVVEAACKPNWPGAEGQWPLHVDSAGNFAQVPDVPWMINTIWMLSDFTAENGATLIVPGSHGARLHRPPEDLQPDDTGILAVEGRAGSVLMWHAGVWHGAGSNVSDSDIRVGLNVAYYPRWMNNWVEGGHQPLWPETYGRMPEEYRALCPGKRSRDRDLVYES